MQDILHINYNRLHITCIHVTDFFKFHMTNQVVKSSINFVVIKNYNY